MIKMISKIECFCGKIENVLPPKEVRQLYQLKEDFTILSDLRKDIERYDEAYYIKSMPLISDAKYDEMRKMEKQLQLIIKKRISSLLDFVENTNTKQENSLDAFLVYDEEVDETLDELKDILEKLQNVIKAQKTKVGSKTDERFQKIQHRYPMLSLENCFAEEEFQAFLDRVKKNLQITVDSEIEMICELKIDGVSFSAIYENGILHRAVTRGDGICGEDITANIVRVLNMPHHVDVKDVFEVRGEIYLDKKAFAELNISQQEKGHKTFANPRNAASGSLRQLNPNITAARKLKYFIWDVFHDSAEFVTHNEKLEFGKKLGFCVNEHILVAAGKIDMLTFFKKIESIRSDLEYDIDGVVYKVNSQQYQQKLGNASNAPRWAIAYKFNPVEAITTICNIVLQVSKNGILTPVAELEPINIGGILVTRATLHNAKEIITKDYRVGDKVKIIRAGDVIPKILEVLAREEMSSSFEFPSKCPVCNSDIVEDEINKRCSGGIACRAQAIEKLKHFVSRNAFNIIGLGKKQIEYFFKENIIKTYADIFTLEERNKELSIPLQKRKGFGEKSAGALFESIRQAKEISFGRFLYSLSIPHVGAEIANTIAENFNKYDDFISVVESEDAMNVLSQLPGIGEKIACSIVDFFANPQNKKIISDLLHYISIQI